MDHLRSYDPSPEDPAVTGSTTLEQPPEASPAPHADVAQGTSGVAARFEGLDAGSLRRLVASQPTIEQAKGLLMGYYGIDADRAFALLSRWSSERHVKVRDLGRRLVDAAATPDPQPFGALRRVLEQGPPA